MNCPLHSTGKQVDIKTGRAGRKLKTSRGVKKRLPSKQADMESAQTGPTGRQVNG